MSETKRYSVKKKTIPIEIEGEDGTVTLCELRELEGVQRNAYLNLQNKKIVQKGDGTGHVKDFTGMCSDLLCRCLYDPAGNLVAAKVIDRWPSEMQLDLFKQAQQLSGLGAKDEEQEKNS